MSLALRSVLRPGSRQAAIQLTLQFLHLTLRIAQLGLGGALLLRKRRSFGTCLLLLIVDDVLLLTRDSKVGLQTVGAVL